MRSVILFLATALVCGNPLASDGVLDYVSNYGVSETLDRLESLVREKGMTVFARIDHASGARGAGLELRPTELLIFGNPKVGTLFMQSNQRAGIDLPVKALAWEDAGGTVRLSVNTAGYLVERHCIADRQKVVQKMTNALENFAVAATR